MSEYQRVIFLAIDRPLVSKQLEYMARQSTRADFDQWKFEVEYNYGAFRGDIAGMLKNGYDIFLNYTNYGCREIRMRLPTGLPFPAKVQSQYLAVNGLKWTADKSSRAGTLTLAPDLEEAYDPIWEFDDYLDAITTLRGLLINGDLRALYVLWLCCSNSASVEWETEMEPPVPHGLNALPDMATNLLSFFNVDPLLVDAAAIGTPKFHPPVSQSVMIETWLNQITAARRQKIIERLLTEEPSVLKAELLSEIRDSQPRSDWPVNSPSRTVAQLLAESTRLRENVERKQAKQTATKAEKKRRAKLLEMQKTPKTWLEKASKLVEQRGVENYREAASLLADLRDAVGDEPGNQIARTHAARLVKKYPTLSRLKSSLREKKLLD